MLDQDTLSATPNTAVNFLYRTGSLLSAHPATAAAVVFLVCLALHLPFVMFDCFGEQDAARLAIRAVYGDLTGRLKMGGQWPFSYPLYIHLLYGLVRTKLLSYGALPFFMSVLSVTASAAFSAFYYLFITRSGLSIFAAAAATAMLQFAPAFFMNSIYGFPTIVALACFMAAATAFQQCVCCSTGTRSTIFFAVAFAALFTLGVLFKVDVLLGGGLLLLPLFQSTRPRRHTLMFAVGALALAALAFLLLNRYGLHLSKTKSANTAWQRWGDTFFDGVTAIWRTENRDVFLRSVGRTTPFVCFFSAGLCLAYKRMRIHLSALLAVQLPIAVFWAMMAGNSARHNLLPAAFAPALAVLPLSFLPNRGKKIWAGIIAIVVVINYMAYPPTADTVFPSGNLLKSAALHETKCLRYREFGKKIAADKHHKIFVNGPSHLMPIFTFEAMASKDLTFVKSKGPELKMKSADGEKIFIFPIKDAKKQSEKYRKKGFVIKNAPN